MHFRGTHIGLAALAIGLASCGGGKTADTSATDGSQSVAAAGETFDPCSVMTADEMTAITTDKVNTLRRSDTNTCTYQSDPHDGPDVTIYKTDGAHQMEIQRKSSALLGGMGKAVADKGGAGADTDTLLQPDTAVVPKLGDDAMWSTNTTLSVRKGDVFVQVAPPMMHDMANHPGFPIVSVEEKRKIAQAVVEKLLAKLAP